MRKSEYPQSIEETQSLIDDLTYLVENEPDRERRRELFLLKIELRDHIIKIGLERQKEEA